MFYVKILGCNSATPAFNRHPTAQLVNINQQYFLVDCGEGTQMQMNKYKIKINQIKYILISHLHGDHYLGLTGLISTMHLNKRVDDLYIYGPKGLAEIITLQFKHSGTILGYTLHFREIDTQVRQVIFENDGLFVETIPLDHRIECAGFLFKEKPKRLRVDKDKIPADFTLKQIALLKNGLDLFDHEGNVLYKNEDYTLPPKKSFAYAYCSDTKYNERIVAQIQDVDLLYHESTFLSILQERAKETFHSTAAQAAQIAKLANVGKLMLGHYSSRYKDLYPFLEEARSIFKESYLSLEGNTIQLAI